MKRHILAQVCRRREQSPHGSENAVRQRRFFAIGPVRLQSVPHGASRCRNLGELIGGTVHMQLRKNLLLHVLFVWYSRRLRNYAAQQSESVVGILITRSRRRG